MTHRISLSPVHPRPSALVDEAIRRRVLVDLRPARGLSRMQRWGIGVLGVASTVLGVSLGMGRPDEASPVVTVSSLVAVVAAATFGSFGRARRAPVGVPTCLALAALPLLAFGFLLGLTGASLTEGVGSDWGAEVRCSLYGSVFAVLPMGVLLAVWRRTDPFAPALTGALLGAWAGVTGAICLALVCHATDVAHLVVGHGLAVVVGALIGAALGRPLLAP